MQAEEAALGFKHRWEFTLIFEAGGDPRGVMILETVAIFAIPHEFAVADTLFFVDFPEDDSPILGLA